MFDCNCIILIQVDTLLLGRGDETFGGVKRSVAEPDTRFHQGAFKNDSMR
jgi:hypothetical protein